MSSFAMISQNIGTNEFGVIKKVEKKETTRFICFLNNTGSKLS